MVKSGEVVRVKVLEVDEARKRISLTLRLDDEPGAAKPGRGAPAAAAAEPAGRGPRDGQRAGQRAGRGGRAGGRGAGPAGGDRRGATAAAPRTAANNAMADALRRAGFDVKGEGKAR